MDNYKVDKVPTAEDKEFQETAKQVNNEIMDILKKYNVQLIPTLEIMRTGIFPVITLEQKKDSFKVPEPEIYVPK